jgi:hypothetical protein
MGKCRCYSPPPYCNRNTANPTPGMQARQECRRRAGQRHLDDLASTHREHTRPSDSGVPLPSPPPKTSWSQVPPGDTGPPNRQVGQLAESGKSLFVKCFLSRRAANNEPRCAVSDGWAETAIETELIPVHCSGLPLAYDRLYTYQELLPQPLADKL